MGNAISQQQHQQCCACLEKTNALMFQEKELSYCLPCYQRYNLSKRDEFGFLKCLVDTASTNNKSNVSSRFAWKHLGVNWYFDTYLNSHVLIEIYNRTFYQKYIICASDTDDSINLQERAKEFSSSFQFLVSAYNSLLTNFLSRICSCRCSKCNGLCFSSLKDGIVCIECKDAKCVKCYESLHPDKECDFNTLESMKVLKQFNTRPCPMCYTAIHVYEGCSTVTCSRCKNRVQLSEYVTIERLESDKERPHHIDFPPDVFGDGYLPSIPNFHVYMKIRKLYLFWYSIDTLFKYNRLCFFLCVETVRYKRIREAVALKSRVSEIRKYLKTYVAIYATIVCMNDMLIKVRKYSKLTVIGVWMKLFRIEKEFNAELDQIHRDTGVQIDIDDFFERKVFEKHYSLTSSQIREINNSRLICYI
jgi:hypothetical protein